MTKKEPASSEAESHSRQTPTTPADDDDAPRTAPSSRPSFSAQRRTSWQPPPLRRCPNAAVGIPAHRHRPQLATRFPNFTPTSPLGNPTAVISPCARHHPSTKRRMPGRVDVGQLCVFIFASRMALGNERHADASHLHAAHPTGLDGRRVGVSRDGVDTASTRGSRSTFSRDPADSRVQRGFQLAQR